MKVPAHLPFISVIIPVFNEERYIHDCLSSVLALDWPVENMEIIVVDNGSTDRSIEIATALLEKENRGRVIKKTGGTIAAVRNFGWRHAKGEILAFLDGDSIVDNRWLLEGYRILKTDNNIVCVGFAMAPPGADDHWIKKVWYEVGNSSRHVGRGLTRVNWLCSFNIIVRLSSFIAVNGFDENLKTGEDYDLGMRISSIGIIIFSDSLFVKHLDTVGSIKKFIEKEYWRGKSIKDVVRKYDNKELMSVALPISYLTMLLIAAISAATGNYILLILLVFCLFSIPLAITLLKVGFKRTNYFLIIFFYFLYLIARGAAGLNCSRLKQN